MFVIFSDVPDSRIKNFEKLPFEEAVALTEQIEKSNREEQKSFSGEFRIVGEDDVLYYKGVFHFGSYDYANLYQQVSDMVNRIKVDKKNQAEKLRLLEQIEQLTPAEFKVKEIIDKNLINLDLSRVSKLKKWQRRGIYTAGSLAVFGLLLALSIFTVQKNQYERALEQAKKDVTNQNQLIENYETALLDSSDSLVTFLEKSEDLTDTQKRILAGNYIQNNEFEKAVQLVDDTIYAETLIVTSNLTKQEKVEKITAFNELYPTNEARYDLAYLSGDYELMLNVQSINMTIERSKMKTYALLKLGKIDEAKVELNNNNDANMKQKITLYEGLKAEIVTLEERLKQLMSDKNDGEASKVKEQITAKTEELNKL